MVLQPALQIHRTRRRRIGRASSVIEPLESRTLLSNTFGPTSDFPPSVMASAVASSGPPAAQIFGYYGDPVYQYESPFSDEQSMFFGGAVAAGSATQSAEIKARSAHLVGRAAVHGSAAESTLTTPTSVGTYAASAAEGGQGFAIHLSQASSLSISGGFEALPATLKSGWSAAFTITSITEARTFYQVSAATDPENQSPAIPNPPDELDLPAGDYLCVVGTSASGLSNGLGNSYEGDTSYDFTIEFQADKPDLVAKLGTVPRSAAPGDVVHVPYTVTNAGHGDADPSTTRLYLSQDATVGDSNDIILDPSIGTSALDAGASETQSVAVKIPKGTKPDRYYIIAVANADQAIDERDGGTSAFDDENNIAVSDPIQIGSVLAILMNDNPVVPQAAPNLFINHFYGTERVVVSFTLQNTGGTRVKEDDSLDLFLSATPNSTSAQSRVTEPVHLNIASNGAQAKTLTLDIPRDLQIGRKYYVVVQLSRSTDLHSRIVGSTPTTYEFVGSPKSQYASQIFPAVYFDFLHDFSDSNLAITRQKPGTDPTDEMAFIAAFEDDSRFAYDDKKNGGIPTIGVGINLLTVEHGLRTKLTTSVKRYYAGHYPSEAAKIAKMTETEIIQLLIKQAQAKKKKVVLEVEDDKSLFDSAFRKYKKQTEAAIGSVQLGVPAQIALVDLDFNAGSIFSTVLIPLTASGGPDYVLAAFNLADKKRTLQPGYPGLKNRTEAEFQNLLMAAGYHPGDALHLP
jgi:hypothetical protein